MIQLANQNNTRKVVQLCRPIRITLGEWYDCPAVNYAIVV